MGFVINSFRLTIKAAFLCCALAAGNAYAVCSATNQYNFSFGNQTAVALNYANSYTYSATSAALPAQNFTVSFVRNNQTSGTAGGLAMPAINPLITDGVAANNLVVGGIFGARSNAAFTTNYVDTIFTFATPIRDFSLQVNDIDYTLNQYRDWIQITGRNGAATYTPSLTTPWGTNNSVGGPRTNANSSMVVGASSLPVVLATNQAAGTSASGNNATTGTISASFIQPVTSVVVRWGNYPLQTGDTVTGQQAIGFQQISFCPMPQLTLNKGSTIFKDGISTANPKAIPGSDVIYSLTVTNSNSSPVDLNQAILTDLLPPNLTFYNGDIDDAGPLSGNFEFIPGTSGLTLAAGNISYTNNNGTSFAYTPAANYDAAVDGLRINPQGSMAAGSSFTVRFRARLD
jgi:uncharacterized repeat protein (TIGR01451 family)